MLSLPVLCAHLHPCFGNFMSQFGHFASHGAFCGHYFYHIRHSFRLRIFCFTFFTIIIIVIIVIFNHFAVKLHLMLLILHLSNNQLLFSLWLVFISLF